MRVLADGQVERRAEAERDFINGSLGATLHLWTHETLVPDPGTTLAALQAAEADYPGYEPFDLVGTYGAVEQAEPGQWLTRSGTAEFAAPESGGAVTINGAYLVVEGELHSSQRFGAPVELEQGGDPLLLRDTFRDWAAVLLQ